MYWLIWTRVWALTPKSEAQFLPRIWHATWELRKHHCLVLLSYLPALALFHFQIGSHYNRLNYATVSYCMSVITMCWGEKCMQLACLSLYPCSVGVACPCSGFLQRFSRKEICFGNLVFAMRTSCAAQRNWFFIGSVLGRPTQFRTDVFCYFIPIRYFCWNFATKISINFSLLWERNREKGTYWWWKAEQYLAFHIPRELVSS